jgi:hypothetical protein
VARFGIQSLVSSRPAARATRAATQRQATRLPLWVKLRNPLGRTGTSVICRNAQQLQFDVVGKAHETAEIHKNNCGVGRQWPSEAEPGDRSRSLNLQQRRVHEIARWQNCSCAWLVAQSAVRHALDCERILAQS